MVFNLIASGRQAFGKEWPSIFQFAGRDFVDVEQCAVSPTHWVFPVYTPGHWAGVVIREHEPMATEALLVRSIHKFAK